MKNIISAILVLMSVNTLSSEGSKIIKVFDGTSAVCKTKTDSWDYRFQAHLIKSFKMEVVDHSVILDLESVMLSCEKKGSGYGFSPKNVFSDFEYKVVTNVNQDGEADYKTITVSTNTANIILLKEDASTLAASISIPQSENEVSKLSHTVSLDNILTPEEIIKYYNGETVNKSFDLYLSRNINLESDDYSDRYNQGYGAFRVNLTFSK